MKKVERSRSFFGADGTSSANLEDSQATLDESTPLMRGQNSGVKKSRSPSEDEQAPYHYTDGTATTLVERPKPKAHSHSGGSMNMQALVLHVLGDALGNVGVIATGLVIWLSNLSWKYYFDPTISLVITCIIFSSALPLGEPNSTFHNRRAN